VTRRYQWESRLSGHLSDERDALELFGDVLLAGGHPDVAVIAWVMAGAGKKAADHARDLTVRVDVEHWAQSPVRAQQAAAAQVIGAQARLYDPADTEKAIHTLLDLTADLWTRLRIAPNPALDAVRALSSFGSNLPASSVDPVLELLRPHMEDGRALIPEAAELLIQLYWGVPERRNDLAAVIGSQAGLPDPPPYLWSMIARMPGQAREPLASAVMTQADEGNPEALRTLAHWRMPTPAVQLAARRACARLLRQPAGKPATTWSVTTQFQDAAVLAAALATAPSPEGADPHDLGPGTGPIVTEKLLLSMTTSPPSASAGTTPPSGREPEAQAAEIPVSGIGADGPGESTSQNPDGATGTSSREPDASSRTAAASPADVAAAVADHLLAIAESSNPPAFVRADALAALQSLQPHLPAKVNARHTGRLAAIAANPALNALDQWEIASGDPLSRGKLNLGARDLPALALLMAANATAAAGRLDADTEVLPPEAWSGMVTRALGLLRGSDPQTAWYGAVVLALANRHGHGLPDFGPLLVGHPNTDVRAVAAGRADLGPTAQRVLMTDPSPKVRANLASRVGELDPEVVAVLSSDTHPDVRRALAATAERAAKARK
jgi:hypothetical protein